MIKVENVKKTFKLYKNPADRLKEIIFRKSFHTVYEALKGVSFTVEDGEVLGIIGPNGAGKSTLLKILTGVIIPDEGKIHIDGRITGLLELGTGFNFEMTGIENIYLNGMLLGMTKEELDRKKDSIIEFSELGDFIYEPLKTYSSGMVMRLAFSIAIHAEPSCFVVDEALSVGDAHFQQKCMKRIKEFKEKGGSIIFVSHDMNAVKVLCDKALLLHKGKIIDEGSPEKVVNSYNFLLAKINDSEETVRFEQKKKSSYGTFEAKIEEVSIEGKDSKSDVISSGEEAVISVKVKAFSDIDSATVGILIRDRFGQDIFGTNTCLLKKKISFKANKVYTVKFELPINIGAGKYTITAAVHSGEIHSEKCYHWVDGICSFEVAGFKKEPFVGIVYLPAKVILEIENN
ncbi:Teichoic-acid-transporting ATPase [Desulfurobacterium thermolithotrophum DSM 11699]|uniref:Teichoic-acid-transporting ATPase n=1 Tax=Desulfurobacterium thermolithotrophum (strain DSM 11699 / BSA) TaxID=868864 RepID=F0S177_DESTD|nr:ABC transporter ATP-binding protein [Desulfurobacterium thermolithotrophum]ADY73955.1 Teichoic-acid-transporting ATPase [Desulfurobacterium thermolithotrophum DSM 11699]